MLEIIIDILLTAIIFIGYTWVTLVNRVDHPDASHINDLQNLKVDKDRVEINMADYASLAAAIAAIGATEATLLIFEEEAVTDDLTVPANVTLRFIQGGYLNITAGKTVTINNMEDGGLYRKFSGDGLVVFGAGSVQEILPEWWGIDGTADDVEIQKAITAAVNVTAVRLQDKTYTFASGITISTDKFGLYCIGGMAILNTTQDITPLTISSTAFLDNIIAYKAGAASTKAGIKLIDGAKSGSYVNVRSSSFYYGLELYSSTATGIVYNRFYNPQIASSLSEDIYIHRTAPGAVNENLFIGGALLASATGRNLKVGPTCDQNKFIGTSFEQGNEWKFGIVDEGMSVFEACRFEMKGPAIYIDNGIASWQWASRIVANYYMCKMPFIVVNTGMLTVTNDYKFVGGILGADRVSTTVDADTAADQAFLNVTNEAGFYIGDAIVIDEGGAEEEWVEVRGVAAGVLQVFPLLRYAHSQVEAHTVIAKGKKFGMRYRDDYLDFYQDGLQVFQIDKTTGNATLKGALTQNTDPTP